MLTLVVIARDEEDRIGACLESVPWAEERIVVDSGSTDDTIEVARSHGATVFHREWPGHVVQKNRAIALATQPWILSLDADERLSATASRELQTALRAPGSTSGFSFPRCSTWLGHEIRHGRWYPDRKTRVVKRGHGTWVGPDPHDRLRVRGSVVRLRGDIEHHPYRDLDEHLATIARYSQVSAEALREAGVRATRLDVALRPTLHFIDAYLLRRGFMDGLPGLAVATLGATHVLCKWTRVWEAQACESRS